VSSAYSRKAPVSLQSAHYMMDAIQSGHWLDRLGKIPAIMIVGALYRSSY